MDSIDGWLDGIATSVTIWIEYFSLFGNLTTTKISPKFIKIDNVGLKFCQTQNKPSKVFESLPKWQNFTTSGHTDHNGR